MRVCRCFLVGCGRISRRHIKAIAENRGEVELVGVSDLQILRAKGVQDECRALGLPPPRLFGAFDPAMLRATQSDFCVIATPSGLHAGMAQNVLRAGFSVLVEKPMALSSRGALVMIEEAERRGLILGVCHQNRFNPAVMAAYTAMQQGDFGDVYHLEGQMWWNRDPAYYKQAPWRGTYRMDGGVLMNQGIHMADLLCWFAGSELVEVQGMVYRYARPIEAEDFGAALLRFADGKMAVFSGTALVYPQNLSETLALFGSEGCAVIGGTAVDRVQTWHSQKDPPVLSQPDVQKPAADIYGNGHTPLYRDFVRALREKGRPLVDGAAGFRSMQTVLAIYASHKRDEKISLRSFRFSVDEMRREKVKGRGR